MGSTAGGSDADNADFFWFNRALTPQEFNIFMADLLVRYEIDPE